MDLQQLSWRQRGALWLRLSIRFVLTLVCILILAFLGRPLLSLFAPFLLALITAAALNPLVKQLQKALGWSRGPLLFGLVGGAVVLLVYAAAGQLASLAQNWSGLLDSLQATLEQIEALFSNLWTLVPPEIADFINATFNSFFE